MKRKIAAVMAAAALAMMVTGCGSAKEAKDIDLEATAKAMTEASTFEDELVVITDKVADKYYDLTGVEGYVIYRSPSGGYAEEVSLFCAEDEKAAEAVKTMLEGHVESQKAKFQDYVPAEIFKLDNAVIDTEGRYVSLVVAGDPSGSAEAFEAAFK